MLVSDKPFHPLGIFLISSISMQTFIHVFNPTHLWSVMYATEEKFVSQNPIKDQCRNHHRGDKKGRPKKGQKTHNMQEPKNRVRASHSCGRKISHPRPL